MPGHSLTLTAARETEVRFGGLMLTVLPRPPLHSLHRRLRPPEVILSGPPAPRRTYDAGRPAPVRSTNPPPHFLHVNFSTYLLVGEQLVHRAGEGAYRQVVVDLAARAADQWATASSSATRGQQLLVGGGTLQRREADAVVVLHNLRRLAGERIEGAYQCADGLHASALCGGYLTTRVGAVAFRNTKSVVDGRWSSVVPRVVLRLISAG
jgi:hypothetical protein